MSGLIISVSGLRGVVGSELTPDVAARYVAALAGELPAGPMVLSRDGRGSGAMLADVVRGALAACGRSVLDAGIAATPTVGILVRHCQAAGAVQISASHNPPAYNGIKCFDGDGRVVNAAFGSRVLRRYEENRMPWVAAEQSGTPLPCPDSVQPHLQRILATIDVAAIQQRRFSVLLDANHGAGSILGRVLLEHLNCRVILEGETPDGKFAHPPEPTETNLAPIADRVQTEEVDVGFCQDPDADRLALIDAEGNYLGEEYTLAICLEHVLSQRSPGSGCVVTNCASSMMNERIAAAHQFALHRSAVGEANVVDQMLERQAVFGGEGNGGPIDPRVGYIRDSFVGMALTLDCMAARKQPLAKIAAELPSLVIIKTTVALPRSEVPAAMRRLERHFVSDSPSVQVDRQDGLRLDWGDRWLLLRPSNTEPIVRLMVEAESPQAARELSDQAARWIAGNE